MEKIQVYYQKKLAKLATKLLIAKLVLSAAFVGEFSCL